MILDAPYSTGVLYCIGVVGELVCTLWLALECGWALEIIVGCPVVAIGPRVGMIWATPLPGQDAC